MVMATTNREARTRELGRELFERVRSQRPLPLGPSWWDEQLMAWGMDDEAVKVQLFRFVDVLPMLRRNADIARHLHEYLHNGNGHNGSLLQRGLALLPRHGLGGWAVAEAARFNVRRMARRFIAGSNSDEAIAAAKTLRQRNQALTMDLLGEAVLTGAEADRMQQAYVDLLTGLSDALVGEPEIPQIDRDHAGPIPRVNVSIKLTSLYSQFDPIDPEQTSRAVRQRLRPILREAKQRGAFINFDMEQYAYKDLTLRIVRDVLEEAEFREWRDIGVAIQAYLRCVHDDLAALAAWVERRGCPIWIRLIKGAYWDYENIVAQQHGWPVPVYCRKTQTDASFERAVAYLIEHRELLRPAIASHNVRSIAHALATLEAYDVPEHLAEFQVLYGMADPIKRALVAMGQRVRVYTPCGKLLPGMAYLVRRLLENTSNTSFLRASFLDHVPEEQLLMDPNTQTATLTAPSSDAKRAKAVFTNEPVTDFSQAGARHAMQEALADVKRQLGQTYPLVIDGESVATERRIESVDPSHKSEIVGRCASAAVEHADRAVAAARAAFDGWRSMPVYKRAAYLRLAATRMRERRFELAAWEVYECAKPWREADADVAEAIDFLEYYARQMTKLAEPQHGDVPGEENAVFYEPRGVAVVIAPWNFPLAILCGMTSAALVAGNTVIMKPAEQSPVIAAKLMDIFHEVGLPHGVLQYLLGIGEEIGPHLVSHPHVDLVAFTGSLAVGLDINQGAAITTPGQDHVKRVITEMGGKNAIIIDDDADLDDAIRGVTQSAFGYAGQKCSACSRVIVLAPLYDAFVERLVEATRALAIAPAEEPACAVPPVIDAEAQQRIQHYIAEGKEQCRLVYAGDAGTLADEGFYVGPHVFADVSPNAVIAQEEIFGPVLAVMKARDLDDALAIANGTKYALTGGFYSRSPANIERVRDEFRVGNLYINRKITGALVDRQPFGGFKLSGIGSKAGGPDYLLQFLIPRTVTENTMRHGFAPLDEEDVEPSAGI